MTGGTERQRKFKDRMYEAGFKQVCVWVPEKLAGKFKILVELLDLTAGRSQKRLTTLFNKLIQLVETTKEEQKK